MKVIARNNGPKGQDGIRSGLIEGKEYEVVSWSYQESGNWIERTDGFLNPRDYKFYIQIINDSGRTATFWNDYFLSTKEIRESKIYQIIK